MIENGRYDSRMPPSAGRNREVNKPGRKSVPKHTSSFYADGQDDLATLNSQKSSLFMKYVKKKADAEMQYFQSPEKEEKYWSEEYARIHSANMRGSDIKEEIVNTKELINEIKQMRVHQ